ncbi:MAG: type II secretion system protein M [Pseudomonadota bacterium]|nr:hypothetical protein [Pseudomonadales bacterium]MDY6921614.1 type II secretion system protein M [Pseudomonadota bacterium]
MSSPMQTLQNQLDPLRRRYASLTPSERWVVNGVALMVVLVIVFLVLILPAQNAVQRAEMKLTGQQKLMHWMREQEPLARAAGAGNNSRASSSQPLQTIVTTTAPRAGITVKRLEPESDDKLRVWLEKVSFDKTMSWLHQLESRQGVKIINISIDAERDQGLVTAKLVLQK